MSVRRRRQFAISESLASSVCASLAFSGSAAAAGELLDGVEEANLLAAYSRSFLLLSSYSGGNLTRVRESSAGNTELDIGHDSDGSVDSAAIAAHCGANDGFESLRHDQSGNARDIAAAGGVSVQPKAYDGATTTEENINGVPASTGDATDDELQRGAVGLTGNPAFTLAFNGSMTTASKRAIGFGSDAAAQRLYVLTQALGTDLNFGINGANRFLGGVAYTSARSYIVRMASGATIGSIRCMQDGTEMTEVSSLNPSTNPNFSDAEFWFYGRSSNSAGLKNGMVAVWNADITDSGDEARILAALDAHNGV